jgi:hypothetical protein
MVWMNDGAGARRGNTDLAIASNDRPQLFLANPRPADGRDTCGSDFVMRARG